MPTFVHGKAGKVLVGYTDLSTSFKEYGFSTQIDMAETSAFGNSYKTYIQGLGDATLSLSGMWSADVGGVDEVLGGLIGNATTLPVSVWPSGYGIGKRGVGIGANESSYEITGSIGDVVAVSAEFQSTVNSGGKSGVGLFPGTAITATANQTSVDNAVATSGGGYALLHVVANSMDNTTIVTIEDSANNSTWATIATFTTDPAATLTSEYVAISGTIRRYVRAVITIAGTGSVLPHVLLVRL